MTQAANMNAFPAVLQWFSRHSSYISCSDLCSSCLLCYFSRSPCTCTEYLASHARACELLLRAGDSQIWYDRSVQTHLSRRRSLPWILPQSLWPCLPSPVIRVSNCCKRSRCWTFIHGERCIHYCRQRIFIDRCYQFNWKCIEVLNFAS